MRLNEFFFSNIFLTYADFPESISLFTISMELKPLFTRFLLWNLSYVFLSIFYAVSINAVYSGTYPSEMGVQFVNSHRIYH